MMISIERTSAFTSNEIALTRITIAIIIALVIIIVTMIAIVIIIITISTIKRILYFKCQYTHLKK